MEFRLLATSGTALLLAGVFLAPLLPALYLSFSAVCHQLPDRSFHTALGQLAVCARCLGVYAGGFAGLVLPLAFAPRTTVAWAAINGLDLWFQLAGAPLRFFFAFAFLWSAVSICWKLASAEARAGN